MATQTTTPIEPKKEGIKLTLNQLVALTFGSVAVLTFGVYLLANHLNKSKK